MQNPFKIGNLKEFYQILLKPLLDVRPDNMHPLDYLDMLWGVKDREITRYDVKAIGTFKGQRKVFWDQYVKAEFKINYKNKIWIRWDKQDPSQIEVEVTNGKGCIDSREYLIDFVEYTRLRSHLYIRPFKGEARKRRLEWKRVT